jgi:undecaprenyl-diphosphatase
MSLAGLDLSLLHHANGYGARHDAVEDALKVYAQASEALFAGLLVVLLGVAVALRKATLGWAAMAALASAGLALLVGKALGLAVDRARPFVDHPEVHDFLHHAADSSFPSDHATAGFAIAGALALRYRRWAVPLLGAAVLLAVSRVLLGVHYPSDVIAGAALGLAAAIVVYRLPLTALRRPLEERWDPRPRRPAPPAPGTPRP